MFEVPGNPELNEAIRDEIRSSTRRLGDVVLFDWDRDGSFSNQYTDLSKMVVDIQLERSSLVTDLPEAVNTVQGYSSAELTINLKGRRYSDELTASQLLSPFYAGSPFFNRRLTGVEILYRKAVTLPTGGTYYIPQFRGTIRDISFDRRAETVQITCTDIDKWINSTATLPHWAVNHIDRTYGSGHAARPINAQWVLGELAAQAGTPIGPAARPDSIFFSSGNGAFIPRVGTIARNDPPYAGHGMSPIQEDLWITGQYGMCCKYIPGQNDMNWVIGFTSETVNVGNGQNLGFNAWSWSTGSGDAAAFPGGSDMVPQYYNEGTVLVTTTEDFDQYNVVVQIMRSGQVFVRLIEFDNNFAPIDQWRFSYPPLVQGWHYFDINIAFRSTVTCTLTVDGTVISPTLNAPGTGSFTAHPAGPNRHSPFLMLNWGEAQHFQMYNGPGAVYDSQYKDPPTWFDGVPYTHFFGAHAELGWLPPDLESVNVWETLGTVTKSEFGVLFTNESGTLLFRPHWWARNYGDPVETYTVDDVLGLITNPSLDQYKNRVEIAYTDRRAVPGYVYQAGEGNQFPSPDDGQQHITTFPIQDAINVHYDDRLHEMTQTAWDNGNDWWWYNGSIYCTARMNDPLTSGYSDTKSVWGYPTDDGREFTLYRFVPANASNTGLYVGSGLRPTDGGITQPLPGDADLPGRFKLRGMMYGEPHIFWYASEDSAEVAEHGPSVLRLEPTQWRQTFATAEAITPELLVDTVVPAPVITNFSIPCDPRLQLMDIIRIDSESNFSDSILAQIVGIRRSGRDSLDYLDLRIIATPTTWKLGDPDLSFLGVSTYLGD